MIYHIVIASDFSEKVDSTFRSGAIAKAGHSGSSLTYEGG
ncbi:hypothetical protein BOS5A_110317 [Bosea sp. EC-HK365B]|nr:hypothetical protein BOSE21B_50134 [Bosea sp. 21B]CAD5301680.1 hypothetical protein BOSE7B_90554 [Bosea sp. 7B]VVT51389.1 hypothetical protein BOS5A_110317 [Bosea sp. EC-HK365B]VXB74276.1 hypothetical protein BOSE127_140498 [Bosea sp. 127]